MFSTTYSVNVIQTEKDLNTNSENSLYNNIIIIIMFYFRQEPIYIYIQVKNHKYTHMLSNRGTCSERKIYIYKYTYMTCSKTIYKISQDKKYICMKVQASLIKSIQLINPMFNQ